MRRASIHAIAPVVPEPKTSAPQLPNYMAMLKEIYGDKVLKVTGAELIRQERDEGY